MKCVLFGEVVVLQGSQVKECVLSAVLLSKEMSVMGIMCDEMKWIILSKNSIL
jgi:hypothetical protein